MVIKNSKNKTKSNKKNIFCSINEKLKNFKDITKTNNNVTKLFRGSYNG